jgi:hypothetical protein
MAEELVNNRPEVLQQIAPVAARAREEAPASELEQERGPVVVVNSTPVSDPEMSVSIILEATVQAMDLVEQEIGLEAEDWLGTGRGVAPEQATCRQHDRAVALVRVDSATALEVAGIASGDGTLRSARVAAVASLVAVVTAGIRFAQTAAGVRLAWGAAASAAEEGAVASGVAAEAAAAGVEDSPRRLVFRRWDQGPISTRLADIRYSRQRERTYDFT